MPATQQVVWTVLPQGFATAKSVRFTVLVSPRLAVSGPNPTLGSGQPDLAQWLDWPATLAAAKFHLTVNGSTGPTIYHFKPLTDSAVWKLMVPGKTAIDPYKFTDLSNRTVLSYPVALLAKTIEGLYAQLGASSPSDLPTRAQLPPMIEEINRKRLGKAPADLVRPIYQALRNKESKAKYYTDPLAAMDLLSVYHRPLNAPTTGKYVKQGPDDPRESVSWKNYARKGLPSKDELRASLDFHKIVTAALDHHDLARWMGMVLEFEIEEISLPNGTFTLALSVDRGPAGAKDIYPQTQVHKSAGVFEAQPMASPSPLAGRYLNLQAKGLDLVQLDVDGSGLKLQNLSEALPRLKNTAYDDESFQEKGDVQVGTPSLRTAGLMLAQERADLVAQDAFDFNAALQKAATSTPQGSMLLSAEHLVRGYRIDIQDMTNAPGHWRSLMQRTVDFTFTLPQTPVVRPGRAEEGMTRMTGGSSTDGSNPDILKIHEGVFVWRGWSLVAPEPFQAVGTPLDPPPLPNPRPKHLPDPPPTPIRGPDADALDGAPLTTKHVATPKTLPTLRFGRRYAVRVRAVDLSGESLPPGATGEPMQAVSDPVDYRRYEPVAPPALVLPATGGVPTPMSFGESMGIAAIRTYNDPFTSTPKPIGSALRIGAAPRVSVRFAETHGVIDTPAGKPDPAKYSLLASQDADFKMFTDKKGVQHPFVEAGGAIPYLPDPMAVAVAIRVSGLANIDPEKVYLIPLYGDPNKPDWPKAHTFRIQGSSEYLGPEPKTTADTIGALCVVPLQMAERAVLRISSVVAPGRLDQMQLANLIGVAAGGNQAKIRHVMEQGQHWMITPWTTLTLVHAVQKPMTKPNLANMIAERASLGQLDAQLTDVTPLHAHSTGRIDMKADWNEPLDDPQDDRSSTGPFIPAHTQHVFDRAIARNMTPNGSFSFRDELHPFHDTRYRRVNYTLNTTSRYTEFLDPAALTKPDALNNPSDPVRRWIASTAPPPPPQVLYVVPTFGWSRSGDANQQVSLRAGGGLRVYLDRPWFSTGFGEMLAVVLPGPEVSITDFDGPMKTMLTQWGRDPIWSSDAITAPSPARTGAEFPLAVWSGQIGFDASGGTATLPAAVIKTFQDEHGDLPPNPFQVTGLLPPKIPDGKTVQVAPHAVGYDADRQLWYCDIVVRPPDKAYYPFIRLALARYQPTSVNGAHLSQVVTTEFQQLSPDRLAIVSKTVTNLATVANIAVYGYAPGYAAGDTARAADFDAKSQVLDAGSDPDLGWRDLDGQITPTDQSAPAPATGPSRGLGSARVTPGLALQQQRAPLPALPKAGPARVDGNFSVPANLQTNFANAKLGSIAALAGLQNILGPGLLWSTQLYLPATPAGGRRRVLITERESYITGEVPQMTIPTVGPQLPRAERIIYAEAVEI